MQADFAARAIARLFSFCAALSGAVVSADRAVAGERRATRAIVFARNRQQAADAAAGADDASSAIAAPMPPASSEPAINRDIRILRILVFLLSLVSLVTGRQRPSPRYESESPARST